MATPRFSGVNHESGGVKLLTGSYAPDILLAHVLDQSGFSVRAKANAPAAIKVSLRVLIISSSEY